jgi:hypothetical protein
LYAYPGRPVKIEMMQKLQSDGVFKFVVSVSLRGSFGLIVVC